MRKNTYCNIPSMAEKCQCPVDLCISDFIAGCICCVLSQHSSGNAVQLWSTDQFHHCLRSSWLCGGRNNCSPLFCISNCLHIDPSSFRIPVNNAQNYYIYTHSNQSTNRNREFSMQSIFSKIRNFIIPSCRRRKSAYSPSLIDDCDDESEDSEDDKASRRLDVSRMGCDLWSCARVGRTRRHTHDK